VRDLRPAACIAAAVLLGGCGGEDKPSERLPEAAHSIALSSPAFAAGGTIPKRYTCSGEGVSPPLRWADLPGRAAELALVVEDVDADRFVHWIVLGIPAGSDGAPAGAPPAGAVETKNSFGDTGWGAPCPPEGDDPHRYVFALYAVDGPLGLAKDASADEVHAALAKHAVARGTLTGRFDR